MKKNVLITGGRGFIARNLEEYLVPKFRVFAPPHKELDLLDEDMVRKFILKNDIKIVIHCANIGGGRDTVGLPDVVYKNLRMFFSVIQNLKHLEKVINFGSGAEYDMRFYKPKMEEGYFGEHIPCDDYGFAKYVCAKYIENSDKILELRLFGVFGKYENFYYKFISNTIVKNILKMPIVINQNVYFDFLYIDDLVKIVDYFLFHKSKYKCFNVTYGKTIDLITVANEINKIGEYNSKIIVKNPGLNTEYSGSNKRLKKEIPHLKFSPFEESLRQLYKWYEVNINLVDKKKIENDPYLKFCRVKK